VHDTASGKLLRVILGAHPFTVSASGAAVVYDKRAEIAVRDIESGAVERSARGPDDSPKALSTSLDDRRLLVFRHSRSDALAEWDLDTGAVRRSYAGQPEPIADLAFADAHRLVVATRAGLTVTWDLQHGVRAAALAHGAAAPSRTLLMRNGGLVLREHSEHAEAWDVAETEAKASAPVRLLAATEQLAVDAGGDSAVFASSGQALLWTPEAGEPKHVRAALPPFMGAVAVAPGGARLAFSFIGDVVVVDPRSAAAPLRARALEAPIVRLAFSPEGDRLAAGGLSVGQDDLGLLSLSGGEARRVWTARMPDRTHEVTALAFSSDGRLIAAGHESGEISLRDARDGSLRGSIAAHGDTVRALAFSPDGRRLASGADDGTLVLSSVDPLGAKIHFTPLGSDGRTCAVSDGGRAECFGAAADEALVCRVGQRAVPLDRCAGQIVTGLLAR
jgi:WD40 repeat protein